MTASRPRSLLFVSFAIFLSRLASAQAAQIFVDPASGSGVAASDLETATELVKSSVTDVSSNSVTDDASAADFHLKPKLVRLGQAYILTLAKMKGTETIYSSQLKAEKIDELDQVASRLTRSVLAGERAASHPRVGEITDQEAHEGTQRRPVMKQAFISFGGSGFSHLNSQGIGYSLALAYSWDVNAARVKLIGQGDVSGAAFMATAGLGVDYFFLPTDIAPYIGADFGAGAAKVDGGGVFSGQLVGGFDFGVGAGVELLRTSAINLDLGFRAGFLCHANTYGIPEVYALRLGLYF